MDTPAKRPRVEERPQPYLSELPDELLLRILLHVGLVPALQHNIGAVCKRIRLLLPSVAWERFDLLPTGAEEQEVARWSVSGEDANHARATKSKQQAALLTRFASRPPFPLVVKHVSLHLFHSYEAEPTLRLLAALSRTSPKLTSAAIRFEPSDYSEVFFGRTRGTDEQEDISVGALFASLAAFPALQEVVFGTCSQRGFDWAALGDPARAARLLGRLRSLRSLRIEETALPRDWLQAVGRALPQLTALEAPLDEGRHFAADLPVSVPCGAFPHLQRLSVLPLLVPLRSRRTEPTPVAALPANAALRALSIPGYRISGAVPPSLAALEMIAFSVAQGDVPAASEALRALSKLHTAELHLPDLTSDANVAPLCAALRAAPALRRVDILCSPECHLTPAAALAAAAAAASRLGRLRLQLKGEQGVDALARAVRRAPALARAAALEVAVAVETEDELGALAALAALLPGRNLALDLQSQNLGLDSPLRRSARALLPAWFPRAALTLRKAPL